MNKQKQLFVSLLCFLVFCLSAMPAHAKTIMAKSAAYEDVNAAVAAAFSGDSVLVPAESATWSNTLTITKGLILKGAGVGKTVITGNVANGTYLIIYAPANPALNEPFRLTGFTFDFKSVANGINLRNKNQSIINKIRVDNNAFVNCAGTFISVQGPLYGVVDNNTMTGSPHIDNYAQDSCADWSDWSEQTLFYGSADNMYYEDNNITTSDTLTTGGHGGRYAYRYNDITVNRAGGGSVTPLFDMHGNQPGGGGIKGPRGGEIYGNSIVSTNPSLGTVFVGQRGGSMLIHFNKLSGFSGTIKSYTREEYGNDALYCGGIYPMQIRDSYYWNNRYPVNLINFSEKVYTNKTASGAGDNYIEGTGISQFCVSTCFWHSVRILSGKGAGQRRNVVSVSGNRIIVAENWAVIPDTTSIFEVVEDCCDNIHPNVEFFNHVAPFDGTSGMGCGTFANRPTTCVPGVGYWATDQDCTQVSDDNIGAHPKTPISGMLYKCIAPNIWGEVYYTPFTYPHPLRVFGPVADDNTQTFPLLAGWNWISFNVLPADLSLNSVFTGILTQVEQVKTQTQSVIRSSGTWKGDLADMSGIGQYKMYKVKVSTGCTLTVTGSVINPTTPIFLQTGWNWVAFLPTTAMSIATALDSIKGQVQEVKSLTQSATYNGSSWSSTFDMHPGQGYAIKMNGPGTLIYPGGQ
jgi:hypothetical protein